MSGMKSVMSQERLTALPNVNAESARPARLESRQRNGMGENYDAEYLALAQLLNCRFVTPDARLHRSAASLGFVVSPTEP